MSLSLCMAALNSSRTTTAIARDAQSGNGLSRHCGHPPPRSINQSSRGAQAQGLVAFGKHVPKHHRLNIFFDYRRGLAGVFQPEPILNLEGTWINSFDTTQVEMQHY